MDGNNYNEIQQVKRRFFAMRNGAIGEMMRRQGAQYRIIFGLNLPQLSQIASITPHSVDLAQQLWDNTSTRESMLLATMIYPVESMSLETAISWALTTPTAEVADILCHKLLRHTAFVSQLIDSLFDSDNDMLRYIALRLHFNLLPSDMEKALRRAIAERDRNNQLTASLCNALITEINFMKEID